VPSATVTPPSTPEGEITDSFIIPVEGVKPSELYDSYSDGRSEGRTHNALDIAAPRGTPVLAARDGKIIRIFWSDKGGNTLYQLTEDEKFILYYAHLDRYRDGLKEGDSVKAGQVLAYVGDTGNAGAGNFHLHFQIMIVSDPKRFWDGIPINPYPLLKSQ
jgi:peptidoglycan LD-endopeptidase LytH